MTDMLPTTNINPPVNGHTVAHLLPLPNPTDFSATPTARPTRRTPTRRAGRRVQNTLTAVVALIATAGSATGMLAVFRTKLHMTNPIELGALFAVFELAMLVCALRHRTNTLLAAAASTTPGAPTRKASIIDPAAVWVLATLGGVISAWNQGGGPGAALRLCLPLIAAFLWERAIAAEAADRRPTSRRGRINWRISPSRILVWAGLADGEHRDVADVERNRLIARVALRAYRADTAHWPTRGWAQRRYRTILARANARLGLATDPRLMAQVRQTIAMYHRALDSVTADAVADASPWTAPTQTPRNRPASAQQPVRATASVSVPAARSAPAPAEPAVTRAPTSPPPSAPTPTGDPTPPAPSGRRSAADTFTAYRALVAEHPDWTEAQYAAELGISDGRLRSIKRAQQTN